MMRVLVCGGRTYNSKAYLTSYLDVFHKMNVISELAQGGAKGADFLAKEWALNNQVPVLTYHADYKYGKVAGPMRNERMLREFNPDVVIAFPGGYGTFNMIALANKAKVKVLKAGE